MPFYKINENFSSYFAITNVLMKSHLNLTMFFCKSMLKDKSPQALEVQ